VKAAQHRIGSDLQGFYVAAESVGQ